MADFKTALGITESNDLHSDTGEIRELIAGQVKSTIRIGEILTKWNIKLTRDGLFSEWIEDNFDMSRHQAYRLMNCYDKMKGKYKALAMLGPSVQYALVEGDVSREVFDKALDAVELGREVIIADIKSWIAAGIEQKENDKGLVTIDVDEYRELIANNIQLISSMTVNQATWPKLKENAQKIVNAVNKLEKAAV